jgi:hypothetical protein
LLRIATSLNIVLICFEDTLMVIQIGEEVLAIHRKATHVVWVHQISFEDDARMKTLVC